MVATVEEGRPHFPRDRLSWWCWEATVESVDDVGRVRERVRSRLTGQCGVRVIDLLLIIDVLLVDAFDSGFAQRDLRLTITIDDSRLTVTLDAADAPTTICSALAKPAGEALLDLVSTDWGIHRRRGRKITWAVVGMAEAAAVPAMRTEHVPDFGSDSSRARTVRPG